LWKEERQVVEGAAVAEATGRILLTGDLLLWILKNSGSLQVKVEGHRTVVVEIVAAGR
jgi:hypothetical protein